jgi:hypothetical protein
VIAALRDPSPEFAERLAASAGDLAVGLAGVLRAFGNAAGGVASAPGRPDDAPRQDAWHAATTGEPAGRPPEQRKPMAKKAVRKPVRDVGPDTAPADGVDGSGDGARDGSEAE